MSDNNEQKDGGNTSENSEESTGNDSQTSAGSGTGSETQKKGYVTEESYKGLQRATQKQQEKLEKELADLRARLENTATELEEAKLVAIEKSKLEQAQNELTTNIQSLQAERDKLTRQLNQNKIVLAKFPELAPLASYIPTADTNEDFEANALAFQNALQTYLKLTIKADFEGGSPPINSGNGSKDAIETEKLWTEVYRLAGVPGKEAEYDEAYTKLKEVLKTQ